MQFRDLHTQYQKYKKSIDSEIQEVLLSTNFIDGKEVNEIETRLAEYVGVKNCITCANGTDAMTLVMMAWGISNGDAVFLPDFTFFSTGEIVALAGASPIFVDVDRDTFNIDTKKLEEAIRRIIEDGKLIPKVIIPVDLFGLPANHYEIETIAKKYKLSVLVDSAQGFGGNIRGQRAGSFGKAATTSFFPSKPLGCYGDGGAIFTNDEELAQRIKSLKVHGRGKDKYDNVRLGINSRLDTLQAGVLKVKLKAFIDHELEDVNQVYQIYNNRLKDAVEVPIIPEGFYSSFAQYTIKLKNRDQRDRLQAELANKKIPSMIYYNKPLHKQRAFQNQEYVEEDFCVANVLSDIVLSLPMHPYLTEEDIDEVCNLITLCCK
ncbi:MAG: DegT/DnrJ/EryC1/StrS aminotransferase family protein [Herbinix sp.]|jgi:dTDP-4-amino-4,6-dideoxygalactose transaminase|nr:DegT/DnrJ/EryC1/StrS aminotransferase family protein [Herbinix sp.]